jgi:hypothetical protein
MVTVGRKKSGASAAIRMLISRPSTKHQQIEQVAMRKHVTLRPQPWSNRFSQNITHTPVHHASFPDEPELPPVPNEILECPIEVDLEADNGESDVVLGDGAVHDVSLTHQVMKKDPVSCSYSCFLGTYWI